ncbi:hypothetical protein Tco_0228057 [Tanacetum coccineum]
MHGIFSIVFIPLQVLSKADLKGTHVRTRDSDGKFMLNFGQMLILSQVTIAPNVDHYKSNLTNMNFKKMDPWQMPLGGKNSDSKNFVCSTCHRCVFNANHDACITKLLKEVNSRAKIQSNKTTNSNKPVDQKRHNSAPSRQIFTGHRFSPNKTSAVSEKTSPRSDLRWKPTGRIFKSVGLRWIPTGKLLSNSVHKASTSINVQKEQSLD